MRITIFVILAMVALLLPLGAHAEQITYTEIDELTFEFSIGLSNATEVRWDFGDGGTSSQRSPIHEFAEEGVYIVRVELDGVATYETTLDLMPELLDEGEGTLNAGGLSVPGVFLLVSCTIMFLVTRGGLHPLGGIIGADVMLFFYGLGILAGAYLTFTGLYLGGA